MNGKRPTRFLLTSILMVMLVSTACTRTSVPLESVETAIAAHTPQGPGDVTLDSSNKQYTGVYAVGWIPADETLSVRRPAGISGTIIGELGYDQRGIQLTGTSTGLGSSVWVEIMLPGGATGWVNDWNLTPDVPSEDFCADPRVLQIIDTLGQAVSERNGQILAGITNPNRGLLIRHNWWNPEIQMPLISLPLIYQDITQIDWGVQRGSEFPIQGSFQELIAPQLEDVFTRSPEIICNKLRFGNTNRELIWPGEYINLNYYTLYRPVPEGGSDFDWRTWVVGFEYVDSVPYLTLLIQYRGDI